MKKIIGLVGVGFIYAHLVRKNVIFEATGVVLTDIWILVYFFPKLFFRRI